MKLKTLVVGAVVLTFLGVFAASECASASTFLYIDTAPSPFWRTATNNTVEISIDYPATADSASLSVRGADGYSADVKDVAEGIYTLNLPAARSPRTEDVYELTLAFSDGSSRSASFAVICGVSDRPEGTTRCITRSSHSLWRRVHRKAILPIPYGVQSLTIDGESYETGLNGAAGWFAFGPVAVGEKRGLTLADGDESFQTELCGSIDGTRMSIR